MSSGTVRSYPFAFHKLAQGDVVGCLDTVLHHLTCTHFHIRASAMLLAVGCAGGPANHRWRLHLAIVVPEHNPPRLEVRQKPKGRRRTQRTTMHWEEGKVLVFDDSFVSKPALTAVALSVRWLRLS